MATEIIGIDVGGTNTDAVLMRESEILAVAKTQTTDDITSGMSEVIKDVLKKANVSSSKIRYVMIGTTHLLNATLQHRLKKVAIIRLGFPATTAISPCAGWPKEMVSSINAKTYIIKGGFEYNGQPISKVDDEELKTIAKQLRDLDIELVAVTGVFAHVNPAQEKYVAEILQKFNPNLKISLSHHMSGLGLLERENATIINSALLQIYQEVCQGIQKTLIELGLDKASAFLSHNDGTLEAITPDLKDTHYQQKPILTLNAGPTNSMRGAARLAKDKDMKNLIVADIGGTSTDVGLIINGSPIEESTLHEIAGISFNFPNIRTHSIGLGGGSIINGLSIGPVSVGNELFKRAVCCGGDILTSTDIAVLKGRVKLGSIKQSALYPDSITLDKLDDLLHEKLAHVIREVWLSSKEKPNVLLLVGGGSRLFDQDKLVKLLSGKISNIYIPESANVANALGAAHGEISGSHTEYFDYQITSRDVAKEKVIEAAKKNAQSRGARSDITVKFVREEEIQYVPGTPTIITAIVSGSVRGEELDKDEKVPYSPLPVQSRNDLPLVSVHSDAESSVFLPTFSLRNSTLLFEVSAQEDLSEDVKSTVLTADNILAMAIGCAFLGSGGGGDTRLAKLMVEDRIKSAKNIRRIPLASLTDEGIVICFGAMGSPSVFEERLASKEEIGKSIREMERRLNKKISAIVTMEIGGANGLFPLLAAAELNIPIVDADCMGRAFPGINMVTPIIYAEVTEFVAVLCNATTTHIIEADNANELENKARAATDKMGGTAFITYSVMDGKSAKKICIPGTLTIAESIGTVFQKAKQNGDDPFVLLNAFLKDTEYKKIEEVFQGRIEDIFRKEEGGFSVGGILVKDEKENEAEMIFQNEFLLLRKKIGNYHQKLAEVPNLIIVVDHESLLPISCGQLKYGQRIRILTMNAPEKMLTAKALPVVGPQAYNLNKLIPILRSSPSKQKFGLSVKPSEEKINKEQGHSAGNSPKPTNNY